MVTIGYDVLALDRPISYDSASFVPKSDRKPILG